MFHAPGNVRFSGEDILIFNSCATTKLHKRNTMISVIKFMLIYNICMTSAALYLWSNHEINISPLEQFNTKEFLNVVEQLGKPVVYVFKSPTPLSKNILPLARGSHSVYSPNAVIETANFTELTGNEEDDLEIIKNTISNTDDFISAVTIPLENNRSKRDIKEEEDAKSDDSELASSANQPVIYKKSKLVDNKKIYALLYSSKPLLFKKNDSSELQLGNVEDDMIIYDTRLNVNIPNGRGKISLRFNFVWQKGYWSLMSVKISDTEDKSDYNLVPKEEIFAPARFSYHCNGETKFYDSTTGAELILYDLQVQIDSSNGKFEFVNDCVPFTTVPICSGIFITFLAGLGLGISIMALMDINTMDKFDNYKTKNLAITVNE
ncbi:unnamed protein product [Phyllotreta striolata]|uniref:Uncharacterized protein n=1 Tax=Phyllotreta striolata TaxID=444603 RepID=A0A9N9TT60_PHYSR|nr:unnamed protein product [Phyllotreta striolata]